MSLHTKEQALDISKACFAVRLRKFNREVSGIYDGYLRPHGLTIAQFNLLVSIGAHGKVSPSRLAQVLSLEKSTVSRNVEKMQVNKWVKTTPHDDKRRHLLALTDSGEKLLEKVIPAWHLAQKETEKNYGPLTTLIAGISFT